jgi:hypothetical protein
MQVSEREAGQTQGFCRISIPHALINQTYQVMIDGVEPHFVNYTLHDDATTRWIYFDYMLSQHEITIVAEFHSFLNQAMIASIVTVSVFLIFYHKKRRT